MVRLIPVEMEAVRVIQPRYYQPAMRLAGTTRAQARGVTDGRIGSDGSFGDLLFFPIVWIPFSLIQHSQRKPGRLSRDRIRRFSAGNLPHIDFTVRF